MAESFFLGRGYSLDLTARLTLLARSLMPADDMAVVGG
jgi:hypothetical protein